MEIEKIDQVQKSKIINEHFNSLFGPLKAEPNRPLDVLLEMKGRMEKVYDIIFEAGYHQREGEETLKTLHE